jgi:hypothetical protein
VEGRNFHSHARVRAPECLQNPYSESESIYETAHSAMNAPILLRGLQAAPQTFDATQGNSCAFELQTEIGVPN